MSDNVLCKDCIHGFFRWQDYPMAWFDKSSYLYCKKAYTEATEEHDPVVGIRYEPGRYRSARFERLKIFQDETRCGPEGKFWSPKNKKDLFVLLKRT